MPLAYRNACYDAVFLLRRFRSILDPYERHMTGDGEAGRERLEELVFACLERLLPEWRALWRIAHQGLKPVLDDPAMVRATKQFTEAVVTPELIRGPIWRQSYDKPFGYPGDYQVMNYIYDGDNANNGEVVGETAFARLVHALGVDIGRFVRTRMELVRDVITATVEERAASGVPMEIMSLGCGPAREVVECLKAGLAPVPLRISLLDHEVAALDDALENCAPFQPRHGAPLEIVPLHASVWEHANKQRLGDPVRNQHLNLQCRVV